MFQKINDKFDNLLGGPNNYSLKKKIIYGLIIGIPILIIIIIIIAVTASSSSSDDSKIYPQYNYSTFFFFAPETKNPCNETNYWTPFDQSTTCYRFISICNDTNTSKTITLMLDHNIATSNFTNYKNILKNKTSNWSRYIDKIDIIDETTVFKIMKYKTMPNKTSNSSPGPRVYPFFGNSFYIINGTTINQRGYWTKTEFNKTSSYCVDRNGGNLILNNSEKLGIRPVIKIKKSLLTIDTGLVDITDIIKNGTKIFYNYDNILYDGIKYRSLQGMTVTNDKLIFMSANRQNGSMSVMHSYHLNNLTKLFKYDYNTTGHGSGMTYNSKTDKVLVVGPKLHNIIYEYNGQTLIREKEYPKPNYPGCSGIGYDYKSNLYLGRSESWLFLMDTVNMKKNYSFDSFMFEGCQDLEYYNGYLFDCSSDFGAPNNYQSYSFHKDYQLIHVYDVNFDKNIKPTKNFGRLVARFIIYGLGELESISFRKDYVYIGFNSNGYHFFKFNYNKFDKEIQKKLNK